MIEVANIASPPTAINSGEGFGEDPVYFCDGCEFKGGADGIIADAMVWTYAGGLNRTGAVGVLIDAEGNYSEPFDLPFKSRDSERLKRLGIDKPSEYWPNDLVGEEQVDQKGIRKAIGECEGPEISQTRILRREVTHCPVLIASMMGRRRKKEVKASLANSVTEEQA